MSNKKFYGKVIRQVPKHREVLEIKPDVCIRCGTKLDPAKYHDCGDQPALPLD